MARICWTTEHGELLAIEPTADEVAAHAPALARAYNDPHNAPLLGHETLLTEEDVREHYAGLAHGFLLFLDGALAGDGDVRGIANGAAEFAFLIASPGAQGKGLGTRFATMIHAYAFAELPIEKMYASIVPANVASRRVFEKLGYTLDGSGTARRFADEEDDVVMSIDKATFLRLHAAAIAQIVLHGT